MRAYEYGLKYFGPESLGDPESNIYAFDDEIQVLQGEPETNEETNYVEVEPHPEYSNAYRVKPRGKIINSREAEYINDSGVSGEMETALPGLQQVFHEDSLVLETIYKQNETYYVRVGGTLLSARVSAKAKMKLALPPVKQLNKTLGQQQLTVVLFLSRDGVRLERAYQAIDELYENEMVFFIERNDDNNYFGSVVRVKSGSNITPSSQPPYDALSNVCSIFKTDVGRSHFKEILEDHVETKDSNLYLVKKTILGIFTKVIIVPANFVYETLADGMDWVSEQLDKLRLDEKRWRYYKEDGQPVDDPQLLLPGIDLIRNLQAQHKKNPAREPSRITRQVIGYISDVETLVQKGIDTLRGIKALQDYVRGRLSPLLSLLNEAKAFLQDPVEKGLQLVEAGFVMLNAFIVGLLNSIIDTIKGIFDLVSLACKAVVALNKEAAAAMASPAAYVSMLFEMLENVIETVQDVFTMENFKALFAFMKKAISYILNTPPSLNIHVDAIAYYTGYIIGFIIEEVVMAILTGGAKTVAEAVKLVAQSFRKLATSMAEFGAKSARKLRALSEVSIDALLTIFDLVREKLKNIPQLLDDLWQWLLELFTKGKSLYDDVTAWLLKQYKISQATIDLLGDLGVTIVRNIDQKLKGGPVLATANGYLVRYGDKNILEGTEGVIAAFSKRIDEIRKSSGSKGTEKYLDEVAAGNRQALSLSRKAMRHLDDYVNEALRIQITERPGAAAVLEGSLGGRSKIMANYSVKGLTRKECMSKVHPLVREWLEKKAPLVLRNRRTHGKCAENFVISDWLYEAEKAMKMKSGSMKLEKAKEIFDGVLCKAKRIHNEGADKMLHGLDKSACASCNPMLKHFNIKEVK